MHRTVIDEELRTKNEELGMKNHRQGVQVTLVILNSQFFIFNSSFLPKVYS